MVLFDKLPFWHTRRGGGKGLLLGLVVATFVLVGFTTGTLLFLSDSAYVLPALGLCLVGFLSVVVTLAAAERHYSALTRLRGALVLARAAEGGAPLPHESGLPCSGVEDIRQTANELLLVRNQQQQAAQDRLAAVLSAVAEAVLVVTESGQVSLVNAEASSLLGKGRVAVGTSVFAALERAPFHKAMDDLATCEQGKRQKAVLTTVDGEALPARLYPLPHHGGAVISFPAEAQARHTRFEHDLHLHDSLPPVAEYPPGLDMELGELPVLVMDLETTGLDVKRDKILSIGAVRMHGPRIFADHNLDCLVNPGGLIPPASIKVHGITDVMVAAAPAFSVLWPDISHLFVHVVVVGHNIAFDLAHTERAVREAGISGWQRPASLDTLLLCAALEPDAAGLDLDAVAARYGVDVTGRHTALGDALVTAAIFARLVERLKDAGIHTLGEALAFQKTQDGLIEKQRQSGWLN